MHGANASDRALAPGTTHTVSPHLAEATRPARKAPSSLRTYGQELGPPNERCWAVYRRGGDGTSP